MVERERERMMDGMEGSGRWVSGHGEVLTFLVYRQGIQEFNSREYINKHVLYRQNNSK